MGKNRRKTIYLANGSVENYNWQLSIAFSNNQRKWTGSFYLADEKQNNKSNIKTKKRSIYLGGGCQESWRWNLNLKVSAKGVIYGSYFYLINETQKYRDWRRNSDNRWANRAFPQQWKQQYEIHHDWDNPMKYCYFLSRKEHLALHKA